MSNDILKALESLTSFVKNCQKNSPKTRAVSPKQRPASPKKEDGRGKSNYNIFVSEQMKIVRAKYPDMAQPDVMKTVAALWKQRNCAERKDSCLKPSPNTRYSPEQIQKIAKGLKEPSHTITKVRKPAKQTRVKVTAKTRRPVVKRLPPRR
jgi:hypothetical protein